MFPGWASLTVMVKSLDGFRPDPGSVLAPYEQLRRRIAADIAGGALAVGERLPSVRGLAAAVGMAPNTVAKVYKRLEAEALVETRGRGGTIVTSNGSETPAQVRDAAASLAALASRAGMDEEALMALVAAELAAVS